MLSAVKLQKKREKREMRRRFWRKVKNRIGPEGLTKVKHDWFMFKARRKLNRRKKNKAFGLAERISMHRTLTATK